MGMHMHKAVMEEKETSRKMNRLDGHGEKNHGTRELTV
jgi:hypothetical protein